MEIQENYFNNEKPPLFHLKDVVSSVNDILNEYFEKHHNLKSRNKYLKANIENYFENQIPINDRVENLGVEDEISETMREEVSGDFIETQNYMEDAIPDHLVMDEEELINNLKNLDETGEIQLNIKEIYGINIKNWGDFVRYLNSILRGDNPELWNHYKRKSEKFFN